MVDIFMLSVIYRKKPLSAIVVALILMKSTMQPKWHIKKPAMSTRHDSECASHSTFRHTTQHNTYRNFYTASKTSTIYISTLKKLCLACANARFLYFRFIVVTYHPVYIYIFVCVHVCVCFMHFAPENKNHFLHK